jgi:hypothetical protein
MVVMTMMTHIYLTDSIHKTRTGWAPATSMKVAKANASIAALRERGVIVLLLFGRAV